MTKPEKKLRALGIGELRWSRAGVPHLVIHNKVSIAYFGYSNCYRVFWPYGVPNGKQHRKTFAANEIEALKYFALKKWEAALRETFPDD